MNFEFGAKNVLFMLFSHFLSTELETQHCEVQDLSDGCGGKFDAVIGEIRHQPDINKNHPLGGASKLLID